MKVLINSYNDADTIERTLLSVWNHEVHLFDGRYVDFPSDTLASTDGTLDIARRFTNVTIHNAVPGEDQCEKRTRMFRVLAEGEYGMKLDGDEVLLNKLPELDGKDVYWGWMISNAYDYPYCKPMIFKKHDGMHYAGKHHYLFDKNNKLITSDQRMGAGYSHETLDFRVFNIRDRNTRRDAQKMRFLSMRSEQQIKGENFIYGTQDMKQHEHRAEKPRKPVDVLVPCGEVGVTFGLTFSREWAVDRYFENFDKLELPECEMICVVDTDNFNFYKRVQQELLKRKHKFVGIKTYMTRAPKPFEKKKINERRLRIARNLHILLTEAKGAIFLGGEDDSLPEPGAYTELLQNLEECDFVQGTIVGRWEPIIPAWHVREQGGEVVEIRTGEKKTGLEEIQGMGWYCFAAKTDAMRSVKLNWDLCRHLGADFHMGYYMWKEGYRLLHNHDVHVVHFGEEFELTLEHDTMVYIWKREKDHWVSSVL